MTDPEILVEGIKAGQRKALAKAITLSESSRADHRAQAIDILEMIGAGHDNTIRLGISGPPGVGKSTFIEAFGLHDISQGYRVAVLAIDPSSVISGGSVLGDKTRMEVLSRDPDAFIRPSPAGRTLGGVARRTHEAMMFCEAAGFNLIIIETVGVGQSETMVVDMTDLLLLLLLPGGGDDLQGIKRGIVELANIVIVNKADGNLKLAAEQTAMDYSMARHAQSSGEGGDDFLVRTCSALTGEGLPEVWDLVEKYYQRLLTKGSIAPHRAEQRCRWLWTETSECLLDVLRGDPAVKAELHSVEQAVREGTMLPMTASRRLLDAFLGRLGD